MKKERIKLHIGYLSLVCAIVPLMIAVRGWSVNFPAERSYIFGFFVLLSLVSGIASFSKWQGKISTLLFVYFVYRILFDSVCLMYA